jgi:two-component system, NarL family, response regulator NreC
MPKSNTSYISTDFNLQSSSYLPDQIQEPIRVMLVDDHVLLRQGLVSLLRYSSNIDVVGDCGDTRSGIYMIEKLNPDIILVDIAMPEVSAFELAKRAKILNPSSKVIFTFKRFTDSHLEQALESGSRGFVSKTETIDGIKSAICQVYSGGRFFSKEIQTRVLSQYSNKLALETYLSRKSLLSAREVEILCCVARGMKAKVIGKTLHITAKTVERHKSNIMAKLKLQSQVDLAIYAFKEGYVND